MVIGFHNVFFFPYYISMCCFLFPQYPPQPCLQMFGGLFRQLLLLRQPAEPAGRQEAGGERPGALGRVGRRAQVEAHLLQLFVHQTLQSLAALTRRGFCFGVRRSRKGGEELLCCLVGERCEALLFFGIFGRSHQPGCTNDIKDSN